MQIFRAKYTKYSILSNPGQNRESPAQFFWDRVVQNHIRS